MTTNMYIATLAWFLLTIGLVLRKQTVLHVCLMLLGIWMDITLVLYLQVTRSAVQTALSFELSLLEQVHIGLSTVALILYLPVMVLGLWLIKGSAPDWRRWHLRVGLLAYCFRTGGFCFMFSMLQ